MKIDNTFKYLPLNVESASCEVNPAAPRKNPKPNNKKISHNKPKPKTNNANIQSQLQKSKIVKAAKEIALDIAHNPFKVFALPLLPAAAISGCYVPTKPKDDLYFPDNYGKLPSDTIGGNPKGTPTPSKTPDGIQETPAPGNTPLPAITPTPFGIPDNSLEFDPAKLEISNINSAALAQIKSEAASMATANDALAFFNKYKSLLNNLIKEKSLIEGFKKALALSSSSYTLEFDISKALFNYYLKYNFLIEEPSLNTLDWQLFDSAFNSFKKRNLDEAENILNSFIKFGTDNTYSSLQFLEKILEKYVSLLQSREKLSSFIQKIKNEFPAEIIIENSPLNESDLTKDNVIILIASVLLLPGNYYTNLKKITLTSSSNGYYNGSDKHAIINSSRAFNTIHEIGHHWSDIEASTRLTNSYYMISWDENIHTKSDKSLDFAEEYGYDSHSEDIATEINGYMRNASNLRSKIRNQLSSNRFELAAKYLFVKYFTPFKGKEFYVDVEPPLRAAEVNDAIQRYKAGGGVVKEQITAIVDRILSVSK